MSKTFDAFNELFSIYVYFIYFIFLIVVHTFICVYFNVDIFNCPKPFHALSFIGTIDCNDRVTNSIYNYSFNTVLRVFFIFGHPFCDIVP